MFSKRHGANQIRVQKICFQMRDGEYWRMISYGLQIMADSIRIKNCNLFSKQIVRATIYYDYDRNLKLR